MSDQFALAMERLFGEIDAIDFDPFVQVRVMDAVLLERLLNVGNGPADERALPGDGLDECHAESLLRGGAEKMGGLGDAIFEGAG